MRQRKKVKKLQEELSRARSIGMKVYNELHTGKLNLTEDERYVIQKAVRTVEAMYESIRVEAL